MKVSFTPCITPPSFSPERSDMPVPFTARSMISGMAKSPTVTDTMLMPSQRNREREMPMTGSSVYRGMPSMGSSPTIASVSPIPPTARPLIMLSPLSDATNVIPSSASMKNSGEAMERTSGRTIGMASARKRAPKIAPTKELISAAPSARPASPFLAIGWPSTITAALMPSPGTPKSTEVMSPVVAVTALAPNRKANADVGSMLKVNGSISASATAPPRPGRIPTTNPIATPMRSAVNASVP